MSTNILWNYILVPVSLLLFMGFFIPNAVNASSSGGTNLDLVMSELMIQAEESKKTPDNAYLLIYSNASWSATILDSGFDSFTQDGSRNSKIEFECIPGFMSIYSISVQKQSEEGYLLVAIVQNGNLLDDGSTNAAYGIASLSGNCDEPG